MIEELQAAFPNVVPSIKGNIAGFILAIIQKHPEQKFIIIIDEYDLIFRNYKHNFKLQASYLDFLNSLFKNGDIKECYIPNYEIEQEWVKVVKRSKKYSYVANYINNSKKLLQETWKLNEEYVAEALDKAHTENTSILQYNDENSLSAVVTCAYMLANAYYVVIHEMPLEKGFADIAYLPVGNNKPAMVVELKFNKTVNTALEQIKNKNYPEALQGYSGEVLLVGINYDKETKKHECRIEKITK